VALLCLAVPCLSCASASHRPGGAAVTTAELLVGAPFAASAQPMAVEEREVLALSEAMRAFLASHVDPAAGASLRMHQLVTAIIDPSTFGLRYDDVTRSAAETFRGRQGNCLSFSNLFVAMARAAGLKVQFQEVEIPPDWTLDNDTYVLNQHVNVFVDLGPAGTRVVDFNIADFKASYEMRRIPDARALAHYYNNIGVERMQAGDAAAAFACFRRAISEDERGFSPSWVNLGTLYLRAGHAEHAEAAYLEALRVDRSNLVAMSSLTRLYDRLGDRERASACRERVVHHRNLNPYYRYELAKRAFLAHDYRAAVGHLKFAVRKRPLEDQFCFLLGLAYLQRGEQRAAERWLARAVEVAATDPVKRRYSSKIDNLLRRSP